MRRMNMRAKNANTTNTTAATTHIIARPTVPATSSRFESPERARITATTTEIIP
jgi:hypothetical protein